MGEENTKRRIGGDDGEEEEDRGNRRRTLVFTYGTLKRGFSNHSLLLDLISSGDASFLGTFTTLTAFPLVCGPFRVPFLLPFPGRGHRVTGELYSLSPHALALVDHLEGVSNSHYQRLPITLQPQHHHHHHHTPPPPLQAQAYYAHTSYAEELWKKNRETALEEYTAAEAQGYIKRNQRQPPHFTFLDHIHAFLLTSSD